MAQGRNDWWNSATVPTSPDRSPRDNIAIDHNPNTIASMAKNLFTFLSAPVSRETLVAQGD